MATLYKNFEWFPTKEMLGNSNFEASKNEAVSFMNFCNDLNEKGFEIMGTTDMALGGKVVHCKTMSDEKSKI